MELVRSSISILVYENHFNCAMFSIHGDVLPTVQAGDRQLIEAWDFSDDAADSDDGLAFGIQDGCWSQTIVLQAVKGIRTDRGTFSMGKDQHPAGDRLTLKLVAFFDYQAGVWIDPTEEGDGAARHQGFPTRISSADDTPLQDHCSASRTTSSKDLTSVLKPFFAAA